MRTTLTLDDDVAAKLRQLAHRRRQSFKDVVNAVLRRGLSTQDRYAGARKPFRVETFRSPFRAGVDPMRLNQLADELDAEAFVAGPRAGGRSGPA
jgi:hypothetical protein